MKMKPDKMLYEKASAMARKMDETYEKTEACAKKAEECEKVAKYNCKLAYDYAEVAKSEYYDMSRIAYRSVIMNACLMVLSVVLSCIFASLVCAYMLE